MNYIRSICIALAIVWFVPARPMQQVSRALKRVARNQLGVRIEAPLIGLSICLAQCALQSDAVGDARIFVYPLNAGITLSYIAAEILNFYFPGDLPSLLDY